MSYSQFREDEKLAKILGDRPGVCVEVGANDGVLGSNTLLFEQRGWACVLVEPNPILCEKLRRNRTGMIHECAVSDKFGDVTLQIVEGPEGADGMSTISTNPADHERFKELGFTSFPRVVACRTLDSVLEASAIDRPIDFISIDVEGVELQVLRGFSLERWRPRILLIEDNSGLFHTTVAHYMQAHGYARFDRTGVNDWYGRVGDSKLVNLWSRLRTRALFIGIPLFRQLRRLPEDSLIRVILRRLFRKRIFYRNVPF